MLPPDNHVHTQWSWDADAGSMEASCARAVELGLPSIAFTDHMEFTRWVIAPKGRGVLHRDAAKVGPDLQFDAPPLDVDGYLECLQRCRDRFPGLRILSGVEFGEPHWHPKELRALLDAGAWQRVLGSLHSRQRPALRARRLRGGAPRRAARAGPVGARAGGQHGRAAAAGDRRWWHEAGGEAVSFGSDAHAPAAVARDFAAAAAMVEAQGFVPGRDRHDFWRRRP